MEENNNISPDILDYEINSAETILLTSHINPDGDGIGSELAFYYHLRELGKNCRIINMSKLPELYTFLDKGQVIETYTGDHDHWINNVDLIIILDIGDAKRIGEMRNIFNKKTVTVCIDHHPVKNKTHYTHILVDTNEPSTGSIVYNYLTHTRKKKLMPLQIAEPLYVALITDTGSFRYSNTNAESHLMAACLIDSGVKPHDIHRHVYESRPLVQVRLLGKIIEKIKFQFDNRFAWFIISSKVMNECGAVYTDIDGFTDFARTIDGVEISCMILELPGHKVRLNFRSKGKYSVNDIAHTFGGGGHPFAAGAVIENCSVFDAEKRILKEIGTKINRDGNVD